MHVDIDVKSNRKFEELENSGNSNTPQKFRYGTEKITNSLYPIKTPTIGTYYNKNPHVSCVLHKKTQIL